MGTGISRRLLLGGLAAKNLTAWQAGPGQILYICPMDADVRSGQPGKCPKCGMALQPGLREPIEYRLLLDTEPRAIRPGMDVELQFRILDPESGAVVRQFREVHEKLFHLFLLSEDLEFFVHDHPILDRDGVFRLRAKLPKGGVYRLLCDVYPADGTPQLLPKTLLVAGKRSRPGRLIPDLAPKMTANMEVRLETDPPRPLAARKTRLLFHLLPSELLQPYLGAWGHLLAASEDTIDLLHSHPFLADGGPRVQFDLIFPRAVPYRIWVQFQRAGVVNTAVFTLPVAGLT